MPGGKFTDSLITENLKVATEYFKATVANVQNDAVSKIKNSGGSIGFIPFKINFTMDGLSGIKIYNELVLDTSFLPQGYSKTLKFIVTGVDHKLSKNDWETTIHTTLIPTTSNVSKITGSFKVSLKEEVTLETPETPETPLPNNENIKLDGSACTEIRPGVKIHTGYEPQFNGRRNRDVRSITLHYTVGNGNAQNTVEYVGRCSGKFERGGIHYAIDLGGTVASGIPEKTYCVHGDNWNDHGIGVEIASFGAVKKLANGTWRETAYNSKTISPAQVIDLGFKYEGSQYFQDYTDIQITKLKQLILDIIGRYPKIKTGITGKNVWRYVFGLQNGKPKPGDSVRSQNASLYGGYAQYGLFSHSTGGGSHSDSFPSPKMIKMLLSLGYVE
jgi:hypothetical protein